MKKSILVLILLLFTLKSFCQTPATPPISKDYYLKKSENQRKVSHIFFGSGTALIIIGVGLLAPDILTNLPDRHQAQTLQTAGITSLSVAGAAIITGIVIYDASSRNYKKASTISFNNQKIIVPQQNIFVVKTQPAITITIGF